MKQENKTKSKENELAKTTLAVANSKAKSISTRGRTFEGIVTRKFPKRVMIEFERTLYIPKYERFYKKKTRIHARLPDSINVEIGDYIQVKECRPLSKIINFIVTKKIRSSMETKK